MDYEKLASEFMKVTYCMKKRDGQKQIHDSMHGENFVLFYISHHKGNVIPSDISNEMGITSARVAAALKGLESKGLVSRKIDPEDRRRILLELTDIGREKVQKKEKEIMTITMNMLQYLGEQDAKEFVRIMKRLAGKGPEDFK